MTGDSSRTRGVVATGVHLPRFRLTDEAVREAWGTGAGVSAKRVPAADEDSLTMAVESVERALANADLDPTDVATLAFATTTPPTEEGELVGRAVRMLDLPEDVHAPTFTQSTAAGLDAVFAAADADGPAVAVVADAPEGALADGDGRFGGAGVAFVFDETDDAVPRLVARSSAADELPGIRFRERGSKTVESLDIRTYERDGTRDLLLAAANGLDVADDDVSDVVVHQPTPKLAGRLARGLPYDASTTTVVDEVGDCGAATVPLALAVALVETETNAESETDSEAESDALTVALAFGGGGRAVGAAFDRGGGGPAFARPALDDEATGVEELSYARYLRERGYVVDGDVAGGGANVSLPSWRRSLDARYRLTAGRCPDCGGLTFPAQGACRSCRARVEFEAVDLPREGRVVARTVIGQGGAPPEFTAQQQRDGAFGVVVVEVEHDGEAVRLPAQLTDCDPTSVAVGDEVRAVVRRVYEQEGVARYGVKFTPA